MPDTFPDLRLSDLTRHDRIRAACPRCGRVVHFAPAKLLRQHQLRHDTMIRALKLRCLACGTRSGFRLSVFDERDHADSRTADRERLVMSFVPGNDGNK